MHIDFSCRIFLTRFMYGCESFYITTSCLVCHCIDGNARRVKLAITKHVQFEKFKWSNCAPRHGAGVWRYLRKLNSNKHIFCRINTNMRGQRDTHMSLCHKLAFINILPVKSIDTIFYLRSFISLLKQLQEQKLIFF